MPLVLLKNLHADKADTLAFGDARVDVICWTIVRPGSLWGNGGRIKAMADLVTDSVSQDEFSTRPLKS